MSSSQPRSGGEDTNYDSTSATEGPNQHLHRRHNIQQKMPPVGSIAYQQLQQQILQRQSTGNGSNNNGNNNNQGQYIRMSKRLAGQTPERRNARSQWQIAMWIPFLLLLLHKQNEIAASTHGWLTVTTVMLLLVPGVVLGWLNEQRDGYRFPTYIFSCAVGFVWGTIRNDVLVPELAWYVKFFSMIWFTYCAANLRVNWDIKRISAKRMPNQYVPLHLKAWNVVERNLGITFFFFIGEVVGFLAQPGGFMQLFDGALSFSSFIIAPVCFVKISQMILDTFGNMISSLSGAQHQGGGIGAAKGRTVVLILMILVALGSFFGFIAWFWSSYFPWVIAQDQFVGAYCMIIETIVFFQKKEESKKR